jgi:NADPH-dependent 2,4-dienoyl-CoA reductase/sulfur reductase-like enzyme/nitrite reductase/ring-hydroxylating ferredoxin subunit
LKQVCIAKTADLKDGEMKQISVEENNFLLARIKGQYHVVSANCPHYGAPLAEGTLNGDRLMCPWHHACFNITNGNLIKPPAFDALVHYQVRIDGNDIFMEIPDEIKDRRIPEMIKCNLLADKRIFVIIGSGAAGYSAAQTLREDGFQGRIVMISKENHLPYDRPNLSKDYLNGHAQPEWMPLRPDEFYQENNIEILKKAVKKINSLTKTISFSDGENFSYDCILVASGGIPRTLEVSGAQLKNIFMLRSFTDADKIIEAVKNDGPPGKEGRAVIIGASFIGMEAAAGLKERGLEVTVVAPGSVPFEHILGKEIGLMFQKLHEEKGVIFKLGSEVKIFTGNEKVESVILDNGESIEANIVIAGIGVTPATEFLKGTLEINPDGSVSIDQYMKAAEGIYAAGDIARYNDSRTGEQMRIEHWRTALEEGRIAAHNMAGKETKNEIVPFFWTQQFDLSLRYVGHIREWDEIIIDGEISKHDFIAYYIKDNKILAAAGVNRDRMICQIEEFISQEMMPTPADIKSEILLGKNVLK